MGSTVTPADYALGDHLKMALEDSPSAPWHGDGEFRPKVMRIAPAALPSTSVFEMLTTSASAL